MKLLERDEETICALSTPPGHGGIAVVRVSGSSALSIVRKIASFLPEDCESHKIYFGKIRHPENQQIMDEVLVSYFANGKSFTGEETLEISTHGSPQIVSMLLECLTALGCRPAEKGEFTYRAFMNGNLDLVQAEAVLSMIESQSRLAVRQASRQLIGELSQEFSKMEDGLIRSMAHLEAGIDFSTEDIQPFDKEELITDMLQLKNRVDQLISTGQQGRILSEGFRVAIVGKPNSGKSSLLNAIVQYDCAIVTEVPGTTRDVVTGAIQLAGVQVKFVDTAGIRQTSDVVEKLGIERSFTEVGQADLVLLLVDLSSEDLLTDLHLIKEIKADKIWIVGNKQDISGFGSDQTLAEFLGQHKLSKTPVYELSAKTKNGLSHLLEAVKNEASVGLIDENNLITSARQLKQLEHIKISIIKTLNSLEKEESPELSVFELQEAVLAVHKLLGKEYDDQVMDRVFSEFCIGK